MKFKKAIKKAEKKLEKKEFSITDINKKAGTIEISSTADGDNRVFKYDAENEVYEINGTKFAKDELKAINKVVDLIDEKYGQLVEEEEKEEEIPTPEYEVDDAEAEEDEESEEEEDAYEYDF